MVETCIGNRKRKKSVDGYLFPSIVRVSLVNREPCALRTKNIYIYNGLQQCFTIDVFRCCSKASRAIPRIYPIVMRLDIQTYRRVMNREFEVKSYSQSQQPKLRITSPSNISGGNHACNKSYISLIFVISRMHSNRYL